MTTPTNVQAQLLNLNPNSPLVELFQLDASFLGGGRYYFTPNIDLGPIKFNNVAYMPIPVQTSGWELNASDTQPRPTITVSNVNSVFMAAVQTLGGLVNARVMRLRTFYQFLDGQSAADPNAYIDPIDEYFIVQRTQMNKEAISWQLATPAEAFSMKVPAAQFLKDGSRAFPGLSRIRLS
jgi:lambda family phage minor tail protein L